MEDIFRFGNRKIIIYGAAAIGIIVYDICQEMDLPVAGFIDKRGDEISELNGLRVYGVDDAIREMDREDIVFIAVKNVFEHDNIARKLIEKGFFNIIYRPFAAIKGCENEKERILYDVYEKFMNKELVDTDIPKSFMIHQYEFRDYATIKRMEKERIVYVPVEKLFTDLRKPVSRWGWLNIPVMTLIPHIAFFKWMDQQAGFSYDMYLDFCIESAKVKGQIKITERWKQNVIKNRADVFSNMNESLERDFDFFIRNAPNASWNENGYFNLVSGKHRAAFWIAKGRHYIPLRISDSDFEKWMNESEIQKIINSLKELNVFSIKAPIAHPFFYEMQCENRNLYFRLLCDFMYNVAFRQYKKYVYFKPEELAPVYISLDDDGYISRALQDYNISVEIYNKSEVSRVLDKLIVVGREIENSSVYSYALVEICYGDKTKLANILKKDIECIVCLVEAAEMQDFQDAVASTYNVTRSSGALKDGKSFYVCWLEEK